MIENDTVRLLRECDAGVKMGTASIDDVFVYNVNWIYELVWSNVYLAWRIFNGRNSNSSLCYSKFIIKWN